MSTTDYEDESEHLEDIYQKKTQLEHILLRPDTYIGSTEYNSERLWILDEERQCFI